MLIGEYFSETMNTILKQLLEKRVWYSRNILHLTVNIKKKNVEKMIKKC